MSTVRLGIDRRFWIGPTAASLTELTGLGSGFNNLTRTRTRDHNATISDGVIAGRLGRFIAADFVVAATSNTNHDPVLRDIHAHRRHYRYQDNAAAMRHTGQAIAAVSLTLNPQTDACSWSLNMVGDGLPTSSAAQADDRTPASVAGYKASQAALYWADSNTIVHLNPAWEAACQLQGTGSPSRTRVQADGSGVVGLTADATAGGFTLTIGLRAGTQLDTVEANPEGWFIINRADADYGYVIPAALRSVSTATPSTGAIVATMQFAGREGSLPLAATPATADRTLTAGQIGYEIDTSPTGGIDYVTSGDAEAPTTGFILAGAPYVRSNT